MSVTPVTEASTLQTEQPFGSPAALVSAAVALARVGGGGSSRCKGCAPPDAFRARRGGACRHRLHVTVGAQLQRTNRATAWTCGRGVLLR